MKVIICNDIFLNEKVECCFTDEFVNKYPRYNDPQYFLGVGFEGIRNDADFINDLESFGIEKAIKPYFSHRRLFRSKGHGSDEYYIKLIGNYIDPIKIIDLPESTTDWTIEYSYDENGCPEYEDIIYVVDGKIHRKG